MDKDKISRVLQLSEEKKVCTEVLQLLSHKNVALALINTNTNITQLSEELYDCMARYKKQLKREFEETLEKIDKELEEL